MSDTEIIDTPEAASAADADAMLEGFGLSSDRFRLFLRYRGGVGCRRRRPGGFRQEG